jgi:hypothetical protein
MRQNGFIGFDAAHARRARRMAQPRQADQRLVEMHVTVDYPGECQIAAHVERRCAVGQQCCVFAHLGNRPAGDADVDQPTIGEPAISQECVDLGHAILTHRFVVAACRKRETNARSPPGSSPRAMITRRERRSASGHASRCRGVCTKCCTECTATGVTASATLRMPFTRNNASPWR